MEEEVSFHHLAELELNEAAAYHDLEKPGRGARFLTEVDRCVESLVKHLKAVVAKTRGVRQFVYFHRTTVCGPAELAFSAY